MVCASVREDNTGAFRKWVIADTDAKSYNTLLIPPAYIFTLYILRCLAVNIGMSMKDAITVNL